MKALRILRALPLALLLIAPARAEQGTIVGPTVGPKTMAEVMTVLNAAMLAIQSCNSGGSAPANGPGAAPKAFQCWADTSAAPVISYKTYDGAAWATFGQLNTSTHVWTPYRNGAPIAAVATSSSAADLTTGTLPPARLPTPTGSTLGGVQSRTCSASQWLIEVTTSGIPNCAQPNFTDIAGAAALAQLPAFSGMSAAAGAADADTFPTNQGAGNLKQTLAAIKTWIKGWIVKADVALGNVDNTSDATKWAATATLTSKTINCANNTCTVRLGSDVTGNLPLAGLATGTQDTVIGYWGSASASALAIGNCSNALTYNTTTHAFGCNSSAGTGTVTNVATAGLATGGPITATGTVTVTAASKSDQQLGTSAVVAVTPSQQQSHPSSPKAWASWQGSTGTLQASYGVSSVTRNSAGSYTVSFTVAFTSTAYLCQASVYGPTQLFTTIETTTPLTATTQGVFVATGSGTGTDPTSAGIVCYGTQ